MGSWVSHTPGLLGWTITEGRWDTGAGYKDAILGEGRDWAQHRGTITMLSYY